MENNIKIVKIRKELGLNQSEFAKILNISQAYYSAIENNKKGLSNKVLKTLIEVIGVNPEWIYMDKGKIFNSIPNIPEKYKSNNKKISINNNVLDDNLFQVVNNLSIKTLTKHSADFSLITQNLSVVLAQICRLLFFIHQYDRYIQNYLPTELYNKAKEANLSPDALKQYADTIFSNYSPLAKHFAAISKDLAHHLQQLQPFDVDNTLSRDIWGELAQAVNTTADIPADIQQIFNLLSKRYPEI